MIDLKNPTCPTCGNDMIEFERTKPSSGGLKEFVSFSCGAQMTRTCRHQFGQPAGGNGYAKYDSGVWKQASPCGEAMRIVQQLRAEVGQ